MLQVKQHLYYSQILLREVFRISKQGGSHKAIPQ